VVHRPAREHYAPSSMPTVQFTDVSNKTETYVSCSAGHLTAHCSFSFEQCYRHFVVRWYAKNECLYTLWYYYPHTSYVVSRGKEVPLHTMQVKGGCGGMVPTRS
jgi:hypothetical protein